MAGLPKCCRSVTFGGTVIPKAVTINADCRDSLLSGVYYIDAHPEQGRIQFYREDDAEFFTQDCPKYTQPKLTKATQFCN